MEMTMNKFVYLLTTVLIIVLLIWGHTSGWLRPLYEDVGGFIDRAALAIGRFASNETNDLSCNVGFVPDGIPEIEGEIKVCRDKCSFLIYEPNTLLTYEEFVLSAAGTSARKINEDPFISMEAFGSDVVTSDLHRDAYESLMAVLNKFHNLKSYGVNFEDFFEPLGYDTTSHFQIIVETTREMETIYDFDGYNWTRIYNGASYPIDNDQIFSSIYSSYAYGDDVYWNYLGDGKRNLVMSDFNTNFQNEIYSKEEFISWIVKQRTEVEKIPEKKFFYIEVEDRFLNSLYHYACDDSSCDWGERTWAFVFKDIKENEVLNEVFEAHENKNKIVWYNTTNKDTYTPITNQRISIRTDKAVEEKFEKWFNEIEYKFIEKKKAQDELLGISKDYLEDSQVEFEFESFNVTVGDVLDIDEFRILIYFDARKDERFGVYFEDGEFILTFEDLVKKRELEKKIESEFTTSGQAYDAQYIVPEIEKISVKSIVSDFVDLNDNNWKEFLKINEINEYLVEQC